MKYNIYSPIFCAILSFFALSAKGQGKDLYIIKPPFEFKSNSDSTLQLCAVHKEGIRTYNIPDRVEFKGKMYNVTSIKKYAFTWCTMKNITIPYGITTIEESTFSGCYSLESVSIPQSVTSIEEKAFHECKNLTDITIPQSVTAINANAFRGCINLDVVIDNSKENITFYKYVWVDDQGFVYVETTMEEAFSSCKSVTFTK